MVRFIVMVSLPNHVRRTLKFLNLSVEVLHSTEKMSSAGLLAEHAFFRKRNNCANGEVGQPLGWHTKL